MYKSLKIFKILASIMCVFILTLDIVDFVIIFNAKPTFIEKSSTIDGIVVFTGGEDRIKTSIDLLSNGIAKHLFISGVNPGTTKYNISEQIQIDANLIECCIDLGNDAKDTFENAVETTGWIRENQYKNIIIVTSDYHMKRSLLILSVEAHFTFRKELPLAKNVLFLQKIDSSRTYQKCIFQEKADELSKTKHIT